MTHLTNLGHIWVKLGETWVNELSGKTGQLKIDVKKGAVTHWMPLPEKPRG